MSFHPGKVGVGLAMVAVGTAPWNAVVVGGIRPSDVALALALLCLLWQSRRLLTRSTLPLWIVLLAATVIANWAGHVLIPTSPDYFAARRVIDPIGLSTVSTTTDLGVAVRWLVGLLGVPLLVVLAATVDRRWTARLSMAYLAGSVVSAAVAVSDALGISNLSGSFIVPDDGGRQSGLAIHPNHLAATICLAVPFACWALTRGSRPARGFGLVALVVLGTGVVESGSRGGVVCFLIGFGLSLLVLHRLRAAAPFVTGAAVVAALAVVAAAPDVVNRLGAQLRFGALESVVTSDQVRATLTTQGDADFRHSPFFGVGLRVALDAHNIWLQLLAAGGVVLLAAFVVFAFGAVRAGLVLGRRDALALAAMTSVATWLLFGTVENLLTDRFLYVPIAVLVALGQSNPTMPENADVPSAVARPLVASASGRREQAAPA